MTWTTTPFVQATRIEHNSDGDTDEELKPPQWDYRRGKDIFRKTVESIIENERSCTYTRFGRPFRLHSERSMEINELSISERFFLFLKIR